MAKGKGPDFMNWGSLGISEAELDIVAQQAALQSIETWRTHQLASRAHQRAAGTERYATLFLCYQTHWLTQFKRDFGGRPSGVCKVDQASGGAQLHPLRP